ncbi:hypothetical protein [Haliangium ochraceum]|uniref:Uncharacterized protein n=1 Tax=Haliangium ochraceum (strain DSM 14365 / JCM 11303 / SMP-2) TaxID=502025 RepID=D0LRR6_HALO1|nr:hypothetical protein [Haliangium ochraceum]ACY19058.1 conserved hypothetical protein [Haliangium ochraceum DSM 14365]
MRVLERLQRGLESTYRIDPSLAIGDFVIDDAGRRALGVQRTPREQLLLSENQGDLELGVFVDAAVLETLRRHDPGESLHEDNFADFLLALEGVSHFVYVLWCARGQRQFSALELELQAEVDKYLISLLLLGVAPARSSALRRRLYRQFSFEDDLDDDELARYRAANSNAHRYSASLERRYLHSGGVDDMLRELRRFYRLSLPSKLDLIASAA